MKPTHTCTIEFSIKSAQLSDEIEESIRRILEHSVLGNYEFSLTINKIKVERNENEKQD